MSITRLQRHGEDERGVRIELAGLLQCSPIPPAELIENLGLYAPRQALSRLLSFHELYRRIVDVHGVILDFGCRYRPWPIGRQSAASTDHLSGVIGCQRRLKPLPDV